VKISKIAETRLRKYAGSHRGFRLFARWSLCNYRKFRYERNGRGIKMQEKAVFFLAFKGKSYSCSPKAIYEYMLNAPEYKDYKLIWGFIRPEDHKYLLNNRNTYIVKADSKEMDICLHEAKYWITNYRFEDHIVPTEEQVYVQCWHGTPLKKLGYDLKHSDNAMNSSSEIWSKYKVDAARFKYIISPSAFASEKFRSAWNLKEAGKTKAVLEVGYPRNDMLMNCTEEERQQIIKRLSIDARGRKVILYAPTWRDNQYDPSSAGYTYDLKLDLEKMRDMLSDDYVMIFRMHYLIANSIDYDKYKGFIYDFSDYDDINHLYLASDMLITDYSSVFFDYANLKRPMLFYMYDLEEYRDDIRGFYFDIDELPGEIITDENRLIEAIKEGGTEYDDKYRKFNSKYNYLDDGNAAKRAAEAIFT